MHTAASLILFFEGGSGRKSYFENTLLFIHDKWSCETKLCFYIFPALNWRKTGTLGIIRKICGWCGGGKKWLLPWIVDYIFCTLLRSYDFVGTVRMKRARYHHDKVHSLNPTRASNLKVFGVCNCIEVLRSADSYWYACWQEEGVLKRFLQK